MKKVLLITNIPTPYRIPLFNELGNQLSMVDVHLKVIFAAETYSRRRWKIDFNEVRFDYQILKERKIKLIDNERVIFTFPNLLSIIRKENPEIVIASGFSIATTKIWLRSIIEKHLKYIIWSGDIKRANEPSIWLRKIHRILIAKNALGFIAYGTMAKEYLKSLGVTDEKIEISLNTVDTEYFTREVDLVRKNSEFNDKNKLLYVGDLSPRKNVLRILKVIEVLNTYRNDFVLDIVGDGSERGRLESFVKERKLVDKVHFHGFVQKNEMPSFYGRANCFLFQTDFDIWGLVLVEAMASGVPCISSIHAGATADLIEDGKTGYAVDFSDIAHVCHAIDSILSDSTLAQQIAKRAKDLVRKHLSLRSSAECFVTALKKEFCKK